MNDVVGMYGFRPNRSGFISCPFHFGDRSPSLKIYQKDFHCHACGANGDIFTFVQMIDNCSFKEAYLKLGGEYEKKSDWKRKKFEYQLQQKKKKEQEDIVKKRKWKKEVIEDIKMQRIFAECFRVFTDEWCDAMNRLEYDYYILDEMNREGVKLFD